MRAGVIGIGGALPKDVITNADLEAELDTNDEWIVQRTGIRERRWLNDAINLTDLAAEACEAALHDAGRDAADVDHVIVSTVTPDQLVPGVAPALAARIGAFGAAAQDVNAACAGFLYALDQGAALVESGRARLVLVCGAEALSRITDTTDRGTAILFGDGAGAVVVAPGEIKQGIAPFVLSSDGINAHLLYADTGDGKLQMEGKEVYRHAVQRMCEATNEALERAGLSVDDVDLFVAHQANRRILDATAERLGIPPEKAMMNVHAVANTSSASIPLALWHADRDARLFPGAIVAFASFGAGFVWGAGVVRWKEPAHVPA